MQVMALRQRTTNASGVRTELRRADKIIQRRLSEIICMNFTLFKGSHHLHALDPSPSPSSTHVVPSPSSLDKTALGSFTDESRYCLSNNDAREHFSDACVRQHDRCGRGSLMVCGGIHELDRAPLHLVQGNLTSVRNLREIMQLIVLPILQAMRSGTILWDDNAIPHYSGDRLPAPASGY